MISRLWVGGVYGADTNGFAKHNQRLATQRILLQARIRHTHCLLSEDHELLMARDDATRPLVRPEGQQAKVSTRNAGNPLHGPSLEEPGF